MWRKWVYHFTIHFRSCKRGLNRSKMHRSRQTARAPSKCRASSSYAVTTHLPLSRNYLESKLRLISWAGVIITQPTSYTVFSWFKPNVIYKLNWMKYGAKSNRDLPWMVSVWIIYFTFWELLSWEKRSFVDCQKKKEVVKDTSVSNQFACRSTDANKFQSFFKALRVVHWDDFLLLCRILLLSAQYPNLCAV